MIGTPAMLSQICRSKFTRELDWCVSEGLTRLPPGRLKGAVSPYRLSYRSGVLNMDLRVGSRAHTQPRLGPPQSVFDSKTDEWKLPSWKAVNPFLSQNSFQNHFNASGKILATPFQQWNPVRLSPSVVAFIWKILPNTQ